MQPQRRQPNAPASPASLLANVLAHGTHTPDSGRGGVECILQTLEEQGSLLSGMFMEFVAEAAAASTAAAGVSRSPSPRQRGPQHTAPSPQPPHSGGHNSSHEQYQQQQPQRQYQQHQQHQPHSVLPAKRSRATELPLSLTLEEIFSGTTKRVSVELARDDPRCPGAPPVTVLQQLQVQVLPGLHAGTRITLPGLGHVDAEGGGQQDDLTFVVQQQQHPAFRRLADDLYVQVNVPLVTALTGGPVHLKALNGQLLQLPLSDNTIITPNSELVLHNQGMPVFGDTTGKRGALHVRFHVRFPSHLSSQQQHMLRQALAGADEEERGQVQLPPRAIAAAVAATAAGMLPAPRVGLPMLPSASASGGLCQHTQQGLVELEGQEQVKQQDKGHHQHSKQQACWPFHAASGGWQQQAGAGAAGGGGRQVVGSPGSSNSTWTAAAAGAGSSSSGTAMPACMQSTGSSKDAAHMPFGRL